MKVVDIRFVKEQDKKKQQEQVRMMDKLAIVLPERIAEEYEDVKVRVRFSSSSGLEVSGFRGDEKETFMAFLQTLWEDPFLLED